MWYRVFCRSTTEPSPAALAQHLSDLGLRVEPHFKGDDLGWTEAELRLPTGSPVLLARYLTREDDLRDDLNAHAAELETMDYSPNSAPLMERVIQTQQLITLRKPVDVSDEVTLEKLLDAVVRHIASTTDGIFQIDGRGWFDSNGELLVAEY
jgi:hypothetical protein